MRRLVVVHARLQVPRRPHRPVRAASGRPGAHGLHLVLREGQERHDDGHGGHHKVCQVSQRFKNHLETNSQLHVGHSVTEVQKCTLYIYRRMCGSRYGGKKIFPKVIHVLYVYEFQDRDALFEYE